MSQKTPYTQAGAAMQRTHANSPQALLQQRKSYLDARMAQIGKWVRGGVRPEALVRFALLDMQQNQKLREADPASIYLALLACAVTGLEPGALKSEAYLVPFKGKAQFMAGYKGLIKMAKRSGEVVGLTANVVYQKDIFDLDLGTQASLVHKPAMGERGEVIGAYAIAKMAREGHNELEWLDISSLDRIRKMAEQRGASPAWASWPDEMQRKTAIRRLAKRLPLGSDYAVAQAIEHEQHESGDAKAVLDLETNNEASRVADYEAPELETPAEAAPEETTVERS